MNFESLLDKSLKPPHIPSAKALKEKECDWEKEKLKGTTAVKQSDDPF